MHYVVRDPNGSVVSLHREPVEGAELLPSHHPDVQAFLGHQGGRSFAELDAGLVRVLEDLIDALLRRYGLLDALVSMGMLSEDDAMGARMMIAMFANPGAGEDELTSVLEFKDKGFFANGQQLQ